MKRSRLILILALKWALSLIVSTLLFQQPVSVMQLLALGAALLDILSVVLMVVIAGALGTLVMADLPRLSELERETLRVLVGFGIQSVTVLGVGLIAIPPRWAAWLVSMLALFVLRRPAWTWLREFWEAVCLPFQYHPERFARWMRRAVVVLLALGLLTALVPVAKWDALTYHLGGPQHYIETGHIASFPENHFLGFPQFVEMLYLWLLLLARPQAATVLHWTFGFLLILQLIGVSRRLQRPAAGWLAAAILLTSRSVWGELGWSYNDLALMALITGALILLQALPEVGGPRRRAFFIWTGVFVGLAMSTKYTAAGSAIGVAVLVVWLLRREPPLAILKSLLLVTGVALLVFAPWLIKNALLGGNPLSPFLGGTTGFDELDQWYYLRPGSGLDPGTLVILPIQATVFGREALAPYGASISPLILALLPLAFIQQHRRPPNIRQMVAGLAVFSAVAYLIWLIGPATSWWLVQMRLLFPIFPALALMGALGLESLRAQGGRADLVRALRGVVAITIGIMSLAIILAAIAAEPFKVVAGLESEDEYLYRHLGSHYAMMMEINELPEEARVLTLWEPRTLYCERRCIPDSLINQWWHDRQVYGEPEDIAEAWRDRGLTHVLIFEDGLRFLVDEPHEPLTEADVEALDYLRREELTLLAEYPGFTLHELRSEESP